jgi:hypothetical protein
MVWTKDSYTRGNHPVPPLSLPSPPFSPGDDWTAPRGPLLFSALRQCQVASKMLKTKNLLSLASVRPRDLLHPPTHTQAGFHGFTQPDTHLGPCGKHVAVLPCLPAQSTRTLVGRWFSPTPFIPPCLLPYKSVYVYTCCTIINFLFPASL